MKHYNTNINCTLLPRAMAVFESITTTSPNDEDTKKRYSLALQFVRRLIVRRNLFDSSERPTHPGEANSSLDMGCRDT